MKKHHILSLLLLPCLILGCFAGCNQTPEGQRGPWDSQYYVPDIPGTDKDFFRGMDVSSVLSELNSGVQYYDFDGNVLDGPGFFKFLADCNVNWIRLRVWNDPFDKNGNGYGGGNNDLESALTMGKWATDAGQKVLINFHYSDFWADPAKQQAPKEWEDLFFIEDKMAAIERYTYESVKKLLDAGVNVGMVQIGNETNSGLAGEVNFKNRCKMMNSAAGAIRRLEKEYNRQILIAVHFTNPEKSEKMLEIAGNLQANGVDYDIFASSYYPVWHGTLENLTHVLSTIAASYGKQVMVAETAWPYTLKDGDGHTNSCNEGNTIDPSYTINVQGQLAEMSAVIQAVKNVGEKGAGVFYWEPAWIPVGKYDGSTESWQANAALWEKHGSGWASSFAGEYDPEDAGAWYGGSAVDNQAMFDFDGKPLDSLRIFQYIQGGTQNFEIVTTHIESPALEYAVGDALVMPQTLHVTYNYGEPKDLKVTWNETQVSAINPGKSGEYTVDGTLEDGTKVSCSVSFSYLNLLKNPGFEEEDMSMYASSVGEDTVQRSQEDPHDGTRSLHFYSTSKMDFTVTQTVTLKPGNYYFTFVGQGGDVGSDAAMSAFVAINGEIVQSASFILDGWRVWANPEVRFTVAEETTVTVGLQVKAAAKGWGSFDSWYLCEEPAK